MSGYATYQAQPKLPVNLRGDRRRSEEPVRQLQWVGDSTLREASYCGLQSSASRAGPWSSVLQPFSENRLIPQRDVEAIEQESQWKEESDDGATGVPVREVQRRPIHGLGYHETHQGKEPDSC